MHLKRWITGLVALPFLIFLIYQGGAFFTGLAGIACMIALYEYYRLVFPGAERPFFLLFSVPGFLAGAFMIIAAGSLNINLVLILIFADLLFIAFISLFMYGTEPEIPVKIVKQVTGIVYIAGSLALLTVIRNSPAGMIWIFFMIGIIFAGDIGAYYTGRRFGRRKICPSVSPGKTVEGSIGGIVSNIVFGSLVKAVFLPAIPWAGSLVMFFMIGAAGQIGDLFESMFKRTAGIKDSGVILPGHGGMLDRIDALLFASPVVYCFHMIIFAS